MKARLFSLAILAACGGSNKTNPDASAHPDSPVAVDAAVDGAVDAPGSIDSPDAPPGVQSRIWVIGDFTTDQTSQAGSFLDGTTLPFGGAGTPPPLIVPAGTAKLPTPSSSATTLYTANTFDATPDGSKIAFIADATTAGTFDLYVANGDGSSPALLVAGQANVEISSVALSPDGTKVAYTSDSAAINGGYDLWFVNTTGTPAPVKVSPDRPADSPAPAAQDVFFQVTWSPDSKYLAFSADLTNDTFDQAYCVDTTATTPTAVELLARADIGTQTTGAQGVRGGLSFDALDNVYFRARVTAGSTQFQFFGAKPDGSMRSDLTAALPVRGDATTPDVGAFSVSPDGTKLVLSADSPTALQYEIYYVDLANPTPTKLTTLAAAGHADFTSPISFSPDGTRIAYVANFGSARNEPYVTKLDGSDTHRLVSVTTTCAMCGSPDAVALQWTADSSALYVQGDITSNNDTKLYRVDPAMTDQAPVLAVDVPTAGDITLLQIRRQ